MKHNYFNKSAVFYSATLILLAFINPNLNVVYAAECSAIKPSKVVVAPVIEDQSFSIEEGSASGTAVGTVKAESNITNYAITGAAFLEESNAPKSDSGQDADYDARTVFSLNAETGMLSVNNPKYLLAVLGPIALEVEVTDASNEKATATITVNVTDIEITINETIPLTWSTVANHPQGHAEATGGAVGEKLYVFGGFTANYGPKAAVFALDAAANTWSPLADMPPMANNSGAGGATHMGWTDDGTDIYIAAGYAADVSGNAQQFGSRRIYKYTVAEDRYDELPSLPIDRSAGALEYIDEKLYYVAGTNRNRDEDQGDLLVLDLNDLGTGWTYLSAMPNPRNHIGSAVFDGKLYVFGGQKEHDEELVPQDDVHRYDPDTNTWTQLADMPQPFNHIHASVFVYGDYIYSIGGQIVHNATPYASVYAYNPETNVWSKFTDLPAKRFSIVGGGIDGKLYASGGNNSKTTYVAQLPEAFLSTKTVQNHSENGINSIKIYPNPAKNDLFISKFDQNVALKYVSIYDLTGRLLTQFSAEGVKYGNAYKIPVSQFTAGVYILQLENESGEVVNKNVLIQ